MRKAPTMYYYVTQIVRPANRLGGLFVVVRFSRNDPEVLISLQANDFERIQNWAWTAFSLPKRIIRFGKKMEQSKKRGITKREDL